MNSEFLIKLIGLLEDHDDAVTSLVCGENANGTYHLFSGSRDKSIIQWKLNLEGEKITYKDNKNNLKEKILISKPLDFSLRP